MQSHYSHHQYQQQYPQHNQQQYSRDESSQYNQQPQYSTNSLPLPQSSGQRKKSLLIGINYTGSQHALRGCHSDVENMANFLRTRGYPSDPHNQRILLDDVQGPTYPTGSNILDAMSWLVSEPDTCCFLHYSGHGGQVKDPDGDRDSGFDDTIVPVDFEKNGQLDSDMLHRRLVSALPASSTLFVIFDCCHSGSAIELPFVYRTDADGQPSLVEDTKVGIELFSGAVHLIEGGFKFEKIKEATDLAKGAMKLFHNLRHMNDPHEDGVGEEKFQEDWVNEGKSITMFSGCKDDQTSADANIGGKFVGAMSMSFLQAMAQDPNAAYLSTLQLTRKILIDGNYQQIPQLSIGIKNMDLNRPLMI